MDFLFNDYVFQVMTITGINIIIVLGLNLITGVTGQLSLGHSAFMSVGAYCSAIIMIKLAVPFYLSIAIATVVSGAVGALLGMPILRLRGDYLAIATLGFAEIVRVIFLNLKVTGGALGVSSIPYETTLSTVCIILVFGIIFMYRFEKSRFGLALRSIREDEIAAEMMGINIARYKVLAFTIGSAFAGLGGALYAHQITFIAPDDFGFMKSVEFISMLVLGGMGSIIGVIAGVIGLTVIPEVLRFASEYRMVMYGIVLLAMMIFRPQGLFGKIRVNL